MAIPDQYEKYRGQRALILTRVSTPKQEEKYSHAAQERQVREKLIQPLGLRIMDAKKHIIHDTYSGLEYRYRQALAVILEIAERGEFDLLCMDVLDRGLGRRALARELFRMQLKELGIRILTTQESDHSDDDSLEGQIMRFFKGYKAEEEITDFVRRSKDGKREKALGNEEKGIPGQLIGSGDRLYGYTFVLNEKGIHSNYILNLDVIFVDEDGTEWTEVTVVVFIFESAANGVSLRQLAVILSAKGIPTPYMTKGRKRHKGMKEESVWQHKSISDIIKDPAYYGDYRQFKEASLGRKPGNKFLSKRSTTEDEQVSLSIPAIITKELFEKANRRIAYNKQLATS
jgi:DNA invertase Pin-like site-specific DNA recombinase